MSNRGRILVVDDEQRWRDILCQTLSMAGFQVDMVPTADEAKVLIKRKLYHLLVFDIRLENSDPENIGGMELLDYLSSVNLDGSMEVIMLSAYGTREQMRESFREYRVADFIDKQDFDNISFLEKVRQIFDEQICINLDLKIIWQGVESPGDLIRPLKLISEDVTENDQLQDQVAAELEDLLCRLFYQANSLLVRPLTPGYSGTGVLWVQPVYEAGQGQGLIVKFGDHSWIATEYAKFEAYVQPFLGGTYATNTIRLRRTPRLGGIVYSFLGTANNQLEDFGSFYRHSDASLVQQAIEQLFQDTCEKWYANLGQLQHVDLQADYQHNLKLSPEKVEKAIRTTLPSVIYGEQLCFATFGDERKFRNPVLAVPNGNQVYSTYICITHGDLNESNIRLDQFGRTWLIDFQYTGPAHVLRDVVKLDSVVRFELLAPQDASLTERLAMEEILAGIKRFDQLPAILAAFNSTNTALKKAFTIAIFLRQLAHQLIGLNRNASFAEYHCAAFYQALHTTCYHSLKPLQREHALLSASLLADQLGLRSQ